MGIKFSTFFEDGFVFALKVQNLGGFFYVQKGASIKHRSNGFPFDSMLRSS